MSPRGRHATEVENRLVVVGQGYVGLPVAMRAVEVGFSVVGLDVDAVRIWSLKDCRSYVDDVTDEQLKQALALVDTRTLDHFVIAGNQLVSFAERGLL